MILHFLKDVSVTRRNKRSLRTIWEASILDQNNLLEGALRSARVRSRTSTKTLSLQVLSSLDAVSVV